MPHTLTRLLPTPIRRIEPALRASWLRLLLRVLGREGGPLPDWSRGPYNLLFIRHDKLGDMIMCSGVLREIVRAHPGIRIDVLTTPANAPALEHLPFVRDVILHERGKGQSLLSLARRLEQSRYDVVIDGLVWRPSVSSYTSKLMLASRARWRVGSAGRPNDFMYNVPLTPPAHRWAEHHVDHLARLASPFGIARAVDCRPEIALTASECAAAEWRWDAVPGSGARVLVNLSAGNAERRWGDEQFAQALAHLRRRVPNAAIAIIALPSDRASADRLASLVHGVAITPTVRELFGLVASADLIITPDTAVSHVASAFVRPTLTLLRRRAEYHIWVPYRTPGRNVFGDEEATLANLPVDRVIAGLDELLDEWLPEYAGDSTRARLRRPAARSLLVSR
ncbi:MAG TPA: glycosyltransferase family 9 protein [Gemmatimonadaceae bacterium]